MSEPSTAEGEGYSVPISALQHMLYCPRQCALIHNEQQWAENRYTAEGSILHERVDAGSEERRGNVMIARGVPLCSKRLGLVGFADVVELHDGRPFPVEYKRGKPKSHRADEVQLCAQAICLEEMLEASVPEGALFYGQSRRRKGVAFDLELRQLTEQVASRTHSMLQSGETPPAAYERRKCGACSLQAVCQPRWPNHAVDVVKWLAMAVEA